MLQGCAQLDILNYRLKLLPGIIKSAKSSNLSEEEILSFESDSLNLHVKHHAGIYKLVSFEFFIYYCIINFLLYSIRHFPGFQKILAKLSK